jgi:ureidoacrylate peracid hydrolase
MRKRPELNGKLLIRGTWDAELIEDLKPNENEIIIWKQRYSGFVETKLGDILEVNNIKIYIIRWNSFERFCRSLN